jgi:hypothetical protein
LCSFEFRKAKNTNLRASAIIALKTPRLKVYFLEPSETFQDSTGKRSVLVSGKGSLKPGAMSATHFVDEMRGRPLRSP